MQVGDLVKWIDYTGGSPAEQIGLIIEDLRDYWSKKQDWSDIVVLTAHGIRKWTSWQCEVISENRNNKPDKKCPRQS